jgi:hypothetical protein
MARDPQGCLVRDSSLAASCGEDERHAPPIAPRTRMGRSMIQPTTLSPALHKTALAGTPKAMTPVTSPMSTPHTNGTMSSPCVSLCPRSDRSRRIRPIVTESKRTSTRARSKPR